MKVTDAINDYSFAVLQLSPRTQEWYSGKLEVFADWCKHEGLQLEDIKAAHIRKFMAIIPDRLNKRGEKIATHTVRGYAQVVKGFMNWCSEEYREENLISPNTTRHISMPKVDQKIIEVFTPEHIAAMFKACEMEYNDNLTKRDQAMIAVMLDTGIRVGELVGLRTDHVFMSRNEGYIRVFGKGDKWREVALGSRARATLHKYMTRYRKPADQDEMRVFLSRAGIPMTIRGVEGVIRKIGEWASVRGVRCSPHTFRHTFAVRYLQSGGDLFKLSKILGHTETGTTEIYLRSVRSEDIRVGGISILDRMKEVRF